jgi:pilus assembly protein CpaC
MDSVAFGRRADAARHWRDRTASRSRHLMRSVALACVAALAAPMIGVLAPGGVTDASAERLLSFIAPKRTASVSVAVGKSEDVRSDSSFVDIQVGDPEIADVNPLTDRALSILGKKIGTTRVSLYGEEKKLVGVCPTTLRNSPRNSSGASPLPASGCRSSANGRVLLSGNAPDGIVLDGILTVARQFGPDIINSIQVAQPQQVMLEVRFVEAARSAGRDLGVQWNMFNKGKVRRMFGCRSPTARSAAKATASRCPAAAASTWRASR